MANHSLGKTVPEVLSTARGRKDLGFRTAEMLQKKNNFCYFRCLAEMLFMWLPGTWGSTEPLSQIPTKQITSQWCRNRAALQKGALSSSNSLWRDSVKKLNSHDELNRSNCQDILWLAGYVWAPRVLWFFIAWLCVMSINVIKHEAINSIVLMYELYRFDEPTSF